MIPIKVLPLLILQVYQYSVIMASQYPSCPGKTRVEDERKWYVPPGSTPEERTYCEECYNKYIHGTKSDVGYKVESNLKYCNCDYVKPDDIVHTGMVYPCNGNVRVNHCGLWYCPFGESITDCTYCQQCYETYVKGGNEDNGFTVHTNLMQVNCDFPVELKTKGLKKDDFVITFCDPITNKIFDTVPENQEFYINVVNCNKTSLFRIKSLKIGDREVTIKSEIEYCFYDSVQVRSFENGEKFKGSSSNVINITFQRYKPNLKWYKPNVDCVDCVDEDIKIENYHEIDVPDGLKMSEENFFNDLNDLYNETDPFIYPLDFAQIAEEEKKYKENYFSTTEMEFDNNAFLEFEDPVTIVCKQ